LTEFCQRLSGEVRLQSGSEFSIFQDRKDIAWGQRWQERIDDSLDEVTFLVPILTPSFFKSDACRSELERFLDREKQLKRNDLILPVYYVNCAVLNEAAKRDADPLAKAIASRQYADWRELRFEPFTSPQVGKTLAKMATQIVEALDRADQSQRNAAPAPQGTASTKSIRRGEEISAKPAESPSAQLGDVTRLPTHKTEPPTRVVDAFFRGDHATLTEALNFAKPGDRILVRPGLYQEGIVIDKPVEIIGDGDLGEVVIEAKGSDVVLFQATMGRIANLTLRQGGGKGIWFGVDITQGRLLLEGCDITSQSVACVGIHGGADPRLLRNRIHDGKDAGVYVDDNGQGTLEDNDIFGNASSGVEIKTGANPTLRRNRIHDGKSTGVSARENGQGTLEDNDIFGNAFSGVQISEGSNPTLRRNRIHDGKSDGVFVYENGRGTLEDNDIFGNAFSGVEIREGGNPGIRKNRISKNEYVAIRIHDGGGGVFEDNDLRGNKKGAWDVSPDCRGKVKRERNLE
jgi:F-box protein 11